MQGNSGDNPCRDTAEYTTAFQPSQLIGLADEASSLARSLPKITEVCQRSPEKIFEDYPKIFGGYRKFPKITRRLRKIIRRVLKISKHYRRLLKMDRRFFISITGIVNIFGNLQKILYRSPLLRVIQFLCWCFHEQCSSNNTESS